MKAIWIVVVGLISLPLHANQLSTSLPVIVSGDIAKQVCYYQDQAYSEGAVIQAGEVYLTCQRANDFETNGSLKWLPFNQNITEVEKPKPVRP
ncbi:DUF1496 domain-containing protein [Vibrio mimicus]|uniref:DUF1496 domain-containing protein n=1 Tax=Vibrio mimicus TaxID=674 RepID=UPI0001BADA98|nr:DUF1496 domain-containing protein [Vibrio mimicus]EEY36691.1 hypothetical protein VII_000436 [Vibrio mimicus MB451]